MTAPQQPRGPGGVPEDEFEPVYTPPAWYLQNASPWDTDAPAVPWHSISPTVPAPPGCLVCGVSPVDAVTIRAHQGLLLVMRWSTAEGLFCGICGIALVRTMTTRTLWQGWWGVGSLLFGAPFALMANLRAYRRLRRLQPAVPVSGARQLALGKPVLRRPPAYVALIPLTWALWLISAVITSAT